MVVETQSGNIATALRAAAPDGIDFYLDSVGGAMKNAVYLQLKTGGTACYCGHISDYNGDVAAATLTLSEQKIVDAKRIVTSSINVMHSEAQWPLAFADMAAAIKKGELKYEETVVQGGLDQWLEAQIGVMAGANTGKMVLRLV